MPVCVASSAQEVVWLSRKNHQALNAGAAIEMVVMAQGEKNAPDDAVMANNSLGRLTHLWLSCLLAASADIWAPRLRDAGDGEHFE